MNPQFTELIWEFNFSIADCPLLLPDVHILKESFHALPCNYMPYTCFQGFTGSPLADFSHLHKGIPKGNFLAALQTFMDLIQADRFPTTTTLRLHTATLSTSWFCVSHLPDRYFCKLISCLKLHVVVLLYFKWYKRSAVLCPVFVIFDKQKWFVYQVCSSSLSYQGLSAITSRTGVSTQHKLCFN